MGGGEKEEEKGKKKERGRRALVYRLSPRERDLKQVQRLVRPASTHLNYQQ